MRRRLPIFYNALLLTGVNLLLRLIGTSFQVYLSGRIGAAGVGLLQLVLSVSSMSMIAGIAGVRTATMYLTAAELGRKRSGNVAHVLSACFVYSIVCSSAVGGAVYWFAPTLAQHWIGDVRALEAIRLMAVFLPVSCLCSVMTGYFTAASRIGTLAAVEVAEQLCSMSVTVLALMTWAGSDAGRACQAVVLGSCAGACLTLVCLAYLRLRERPTVGARIPVAGKLLQTAVPLALADDLRAGISTVENLMVPKRLALFPGVGDPMALFGTICGMVFPVLTFPTAILFGLTELLIPELARCNAAGSHARIRYLVRRSLRVAMIYGAVFCGLLYLLSEELCILLYRSREAGIYLRWFSLLAPMLYCDAIIDAMTKGLGQQRACVRYNILTSAMDVAMLYVLLPGYGVVGYYVSFLISHLVNVVLSLRRLLKITQIRIPLRVPVCTVAVIAAAIWAAAHVRELVAQAGAYLALLLSALFLLKILRREDWDWLRGMIKPRGASS